MRRTLLAFAAAGLAAAAAAPALFAGDAAPPAPPHSPAPPAPPAPIDPAQVTRLVEDLGSDDFRVREAATKALSEMGETARPALEAAVKSDNAAVRFRAEQILERLKGGPREKPLDDSGGPVAPRPTIRRFQIKPNVPANQDFEREVRRLREDMDKQMKEFEERMRSAGGQSLFTTWSNDWANALAKVPAPLRVTADGGTVNAELIERPRVARITFTEKADPTNVTTFSGASVEKILASRPQVRDWPGAKDLLARYEEEKARREEAAKEAAKALESGGATSSQNRSVQIVQDENGVKVTVTEDGPDGKPVTKTYEGTDLETLKRENPELAKALGGALFGAGGSVRLRIVPGTPGTREQPFGGLVIEEDDSDGPITVFPNRGGATITSTGPFGLALGAADEAGAVVLAVRPNSDAAKAGLEIDDVITAVNGTAIKDTGDVAKVLRARAAGTAVTFQVIRGGKSITLPETPK